MINDLKIKIKKNTSIKVNKDFIIAISIFMLAKGIAISSLYDLIFLKTNQLAIISMLKISTYIILLLCSLIFLYKIKKYNTHKS